MASGSLIFAIVGGNVGGCKYQPGYEPIADCIGADAVIVPRLGTHSFWLSHIGSSEFAPGTGGRAEVIPFIWDHQGERDNLCPE